MSIGTIIVPIVPNNCAYWQCLCDRDRIYVPTLPNSVFYFRAENMSFAYFAKKSPDVNFEFWMFNFTIIAKWLCFWIGRAARCFFSLIFVFLRFSFINVFLLIAAAHDWRRILSVSLSPEDCMRIHETLSSDNYEFLLQRYIYIYILQMNHTK